MKKLFSLIATVLFAGSMMAEPVVLDYSAKGYDNNTPLDSVPVTEGDITVTIIKGTGSTAPAYYTTGTGARTYGGNVLKVESATKMIIAIQFNLTQNNKNYTVDAGTYSEEDAMWAGSAKSVTFTTESGNGHNRIKSIKVYFEGDSVDVPTDIEATVAEAIIAGNKLDSMAISEDTYIVTGYVVNSQPFNLQYGNQIWYMADDSLNTLSQEFEAYGCNVVEAGTPKQVIDGDKVKLTGKLTKYYDKNEGKFIIEIKNGVAEFIEKAEGDHDLPVIKVDTINVAQAIAEAQKLTPESGKSAATEETYAVKGYIAKVKDAYNPQYGNITFFMSDDSTATSGDFQAYRCKISATDATKAVEGAFVLVTGPITNYNGGSFNNYEVAQGTVEILAEAPVIVLDTLSVAEALEHAQALAVGAQEKAIVRAYIANIKTPFDTTYNNVTVWLTDDATSTYGDLQAYRAKCSAEDGAALAEHDLVLIEGYLTHTQNQEKTKDYYELASGAQLRILEKAQGIENIVLTEKAQKVMVDGVVYIVRDNKLFNIQGTQIR